MFNLKCLIYIFLLSLEVLLKECYKLMGDCLVKCLVNVMDWDFESKILIEFIWY